MSRGATAFEVPCHGSAEALGDIFWRRILAGSSDQCPRTAMTVTVEDDHEDASFSKNHIHGVGDLCEDGCLIPLGEAGCIDLPAMDKIFSWQCVRFQKPRSPLAEIVVVVVVDFIYSR